MSVLNIILLVILIFLIGSNLKVELFDANGLEFLPLGPKRYGLRGELLNTHPMSDCYYDKYVCYGNTFGFFR